MDIVEQLVDNVEATSYERLPVEAVEAARMSILETLGALIAGATAEGCREVVGLVRGWGGKPESTVLVHGDKVPAHNAALAGATMARALEIDDAAEKGMHPSAASVPAALAVAERRGGVSGKELIAAIAAGEDLAIRLNLATTPYAEGKISRVGTCMPLGVAAITAKLLGLDKTGMWNALGIAYAQSAGNFQSIVDGALAERVTQGFAASAGIVSAELAQTGISGPRNILQGIHGFFKMFSRDQGDLKVLMAGLGQEYMGTQTHRKRYPSCGCTLSCTDAIMELRREHGIRPDDVDGVLVTVSRHMYTTGGPPFQVRNNPQIDAQFSIPYTVANALLRGKPRLEHFTPASVQEEEVLALSGRVRCVASDEELKRRAGLYCSTVVEVRMKNGTKHSQFTRSAVGSPPGRPLTYAEVLEKFNDCIAYARIPSLERNAGKIVDMVGNLESVDDVRQIILLLVA
ncbi:MAG: MmgE/PrpD family protein [Chloroflexi bacterium]|nr:MmgE/PrpD family protein [Chloroflexota bacterium]